MNNKHLIAAALGLAAVGASAQTVDELKRMLAERDTTIADLRQRLAAVQPGTAARATPAPAASAAADDDESRRALERALVREGALVLPPYAFELTPQLSYAHWNHARGTALRNSYTASLGLRLGLPGDAQIQLEIPYVRNTSAPASGSGLGDVDISFTKELLREGAGRPGLLATVGYTAGTGDDGLTTGVPLGAGVHAWRGGLTAVKRLDPMVFFGALTYAVPSSRTISGVDYAPGNVVGLRLGGVLAASPDTSVSAGLNLGFPRSTRVGGIAVPDSNEPYGTLSLGVGTVLSRNVMLNVGADVRVMGNAPNMRLTVSLPVRF
ncbi:MAG: hypothetical protein V4864_17570 [Pseudomonadota bacterium]